MEKARDAYLRHQSNTPNLKKFIYGQGKIRSWQGKKLGGFESDRL